jgi:hypothetical protein
MNQREKGARHHLPERPEGGHRREALVVAQMVPGTFFHQSDSLWQVFNFLERTEKLSFHLTNWQYTCFGASLGLAKS